MSSKIQIAFDLDNSQLKNVYSKTTGKYYKHAYYELKKEFEKLGYKHRQGSVYHSVKRKTHAEVTLDMIQLCDDKPWFLTCARVIDYAELNNQHDILKQLKDHKNTGNLLNNEKENAFQTQPTKNAQERNDFNEMFEKLWGEKSKKKIIQKNKNHSLKKDDFER